jgi:hypothetical protein
MQFELLQQKLESLIWLIGSRRTASHGMNHSMIVTTARSATVVSISPRNALSLSIGKPHLGGGWPAVLTQAYVERHQIAFAQLGTAIDPKSDGRINLSSHHRAE